MSRNPGALIALPLFALVCCSACVPAKPGKQAAASAEKPATTPHAEARLTGEMTIFHAGSLSVPFQEVTKLFNESHPDVRVLTEAAGSRDTARKVSDLGRSCDVLGSADYLVIDSLLIPEHASYNILFSTNEMAIAHTDRSKGADRIDAGNWPQVLLEDGVVFGRAEPDSDPCGYRTVMCLQLAGKHYGIAGLEGKFLASKGQMIRPKETDLLALLESGEIDYLFIYRSVAEQHRLRYLLLPDEVNLKSAELADLYAAAVVELSGKEPGTTVTQTGAPMVYGATIPLNAERPDLAEAWLATLLSPEGLGIMERMGQPAISPPLASGYSGLPESIKALCEPLERDERID